MFWATLQLSETCGVLLHEIVGISSSSCPVGWLLETSRVLAVGVIWLGQ